MSLIPPVPLILSKIKYHVQNRFKDDSEECKKVLDKLGPFFVFKLTANFRSLENGTCNELEDIAEYIQDKTVQWDCIDTSLNMFTRMRNHLHSVITNPGVLRLAICHKIDDGDEKQPWSDMFCDEQPVNVKGIQDENGNELTLQDKYKSKLQKLKSERTAA